MELETINEIARVGEEGKNTHPLRLRALEAVTLTDITKVHFSQVESQVRVERGKGEKVPSKLFLPVAIRSLSGLDLAV